MIFPTLHFHALQWIFWSAIFVVFYSYLGYGILLYLLVRLKRLFFKPKNVNRIGSDDDLPEVTFMVAAYNEEDWIEQKIRNSYALDYPKTKIHFFFVTDGSNDETNERIINYPNQEGAKMQLFHLPERRGKIAAVDRVMAFVETPIIVYTDANTDLNPFAIRNIVRHYQNPKIGAVAGEKRIAQSEREEAAGAGEGIYWKYESLLKRWDAELYSVVGAAGELFSIRTELFEAVPKDTIIEDFYLTLRIAQKGFRVAYEPTAYASEGRSASVGEELKRKIRIAAGGLQAVWRLRALLNPFRYGVLTFQYISHRVLRWTLAPVLLPIIFIANILLALQGNLFYQLVLLAQIIFYFAATLGWILETRQIKVKLLFVPYYFCIMNYAVYRGFFRYISRQQSVVWEKAKRAETVVGV
jgi:poly-beta-1,6-N-acetyl-D-glucosamine synthase